MAEAHDHGGPTGWGVEVFGDDMGFCGKGVGGRKSLPALLWGSVGCSGRKRLLTMREGMQGRGPRLFPF